jgi:hypothetical protein
MDAHHHHHTLFNLHAGSLGGLDFVFKGKHVNGDGVFTSIILKTAREE